MIDDISDNIDFFKSNPELFESLKSCIEDFIQVIRKESIMKSYINDLEKISYFKNNKQVLSELSESFVEYANVDYPNDILIHALHHMNDGRFNICCGIYNVEFFIRNNEFKFKFDINGKI